MIFFSWEGNMKWEGMKTTDLIFQVCFIFFFNFVYEDLLIIVIYQAFCLDVAQDHMNRPLRETQTHLWRLASSTC